MTDAAIPLPVREGRARRHREEARAVRNTRRVRRLRVVVPVAAGAIALALFGAALVPKLLPFPLSGLSLTADGLVMNDPRLAGSLGEGRRYEVVASRAVQSLLDPSRLTLEDLDARLQLEGGTDASLRSAAAAYDTETEVLDLSSGVVISSSDGNEARLAAATVYLKDGRAESDEGIVVNSPRGHIKAGAVQILDGGARIKFSGGVSITIDPAT